MISTPLLFIIFIIYIFAIQQIYGYLRSGSVTYNLINFIDRICQSVSKRKNCFNGNGWHPKIPLYKRIFASTTAISLFIIFPFITELGAENE